jgi:enterobactin synthetase component D
MLLARNLSNPGQVYSSLWSPGGPRIYFTHFTLPAFDRSYFAMNGIDCPANIAGAVPKRQAEYFYGRLCSQAALSTLGLTGIQVGTGTLREPLWPAGYTGSITHNGSIAAAVVVREDDVVGVGIDIETVSQGSTSDALRATIVSQRELDYLASLNGDVSGDTLLTLVFSAKESFYKGVSGMVRRVLDFDVIELIGIDIAANTLCFRVNAPLGEQFQPGHQFQVEFKLLDDATLMTMFYRRA